ncbi:MAG: hypothetical protein K6T57_12505 [Thermaceae bacterium]|nr:hypothetical protein [Thermaceae bacterium]
MKHWLLALSTITLLGMSEAQESTLYRGFAELKQEQNLPPGQWVWEPGEAWYDNLIPGTLRLSGVLKQSRQIQAAAPNPLAAYVGKKVQFFWEGQWREATVVSADKNLFLYEGRYLVGLPGPIGYPDPSGFSGLTGPKITFRYQGSGPARLSYLTRAVSWNLRYTLENGELVGWASLNNSLDRAVQLGRTELVAGVVPVVEGRGMPLGRTPGAAPMMADLAMAEFVGEAGGTYRYKLPGEITLEPGSLELPFLRSRVAPVYLWRYQGGFSSAQELTFARGYRFQAPENLAAGTVSLREGSTFVGQASMPDTAKGGEVRLILGPDPEGRALRRLEPRAQNTYRVITTVQNPKTYPIEVELGESFPQPFTLEIQGAERTPEGYRLKFTLAPGQSRTLEYTVTFPQQP